MAEGLRQGEDRRIRLKFQIWDQDLEANIPYTLAPGEDIETILHVRDHELKRYKLSDGTIVAGEEEGEYIYHILGEDSVKFPVGPLTQTMRIKLNDAEFVDGFKDVDVSKLEEVLPAKSF